MNEFMSGDFQLMRKKVIELSESNLEMREMVNRLANQVETLQTENVKLTTDVRIIR